MPGRPLRSYPGLLSTGVTALGWVNSGAPDGAVVVAGYQVSPRGRSGRPWKATLGRGLGFSLVMYPGLPAGREGWLYTVALAALADVYGAAATIQWPDEVRREGETVAAVGVQSRLDRKSVKWAIVDVMLPHAEPPRSERNRAERHRRSPRQRRERGDGGLRPQVRDDRPARRDAASGRYRPRIEGTAVGTLEDGALLLETPKGVPAPVRPQDIREVETA